MSHTDDAALYFRPKPEDFPITVTFTTASGETIRTATITNPATLKIASVPRINPDPNLQEWPDL